MNSFILEKKTPSKENLLHIQENDVMKTYFKVPK